MLFYREGPSATTKVLLDPDTRERSMSVDGVDIGVVGAITLHNGAAYEFSFFASEEEMDRWLPIIEQLLQSFRFLDS